MVGLKFREDIVKKVTGLLAEVHIGYIKMWVGIVNSDINRAKKILVSWSFLTT